MENISMNQALSVWSELEQAYFGKNGYGGNVAEIYAYRVQSYDPTASLGGNSHFVTEARDRQKMLAGVSLFRLIKKFSEDRDCVIEVDGYDPEVLIQYGLVHRCHVKVTPK